MEGKESVYEICNKISSETSFSFDDVYYVYCAIADEEKTRELLNVACSSNVSIYHLVNACREPAKKITPVKHSVWFRIKMGLAGLLKKLKNLIFKSCSNCHYENHSWFKHHCRECKKDNRFKGWLKR